jgi:hypothetical protein
MRGMNQNEVEIIAGWIYDHFSIEKRISGYHSERHITRTDFIKRVMRDCL